MLFLLTAETIPMKSPTRIDKIMLTVVSSKVAGK